MHCGRCVPCLVRRASFIRAGQEDRTVYKHALLKEAQPDYEPNDVGAVAAAVVKVEQWGIRDFTAGQMSFAATHQRLDFEGVVGRGLAELGTLLRQQRIL
jgi:hypothetical protein